MRLYQQKQNLGGQPDSVLATKDGANEYNSPRNELKNSVTIAGLTPAPADGTGEDITQLAQALMINGAGASSFQAAGTVDAITLTPVTGVSGLKLPPDYTSLHGFRVGFYPTGVNTGNVTISIGQDAGSQFGVKKALNSDGSEIAATTLSTTVYSEFIYDETADASAGAFILVPYSLATGGAGSDTTKVDKDLSSDVVYAPTAAVADDDLYYVEKNGATAGKISGLNLKAALTAEVVDIQEFTSSGIWTKPATGARVLVQIWGAGGSGGRAGAGNGGGGGGGGAYTEVWFNIGDLGVTETVTIGAGGAAITVDETDGNTGGNTTFGSLLSIFGGGGGGGNTATDGAGGGGGGLNSAGISATGLTPGGGGAPLGGSPSTFGGGDGSPVEGLPGYSVNGGGGGGFGTNAPSPASDGGDSQNGGGGGGGGDGDSPATAIGGVSITGGNGGIGGSDANPGGDGIQPGGGGGGSETGDSGAGADGQCIVTTF